MNDVIYDVTAFLIIVKNFKNPITYVAKKTKKISFVFVII